MYTRRTFRTSRLLRVTLRGASRALPVTLIICAAWELLGVRWLQLPSLVISILGTAVSFYLGFKGNAAYGRLWEARKIWGGIVNTSRSWGIHVTGFVRQGNGQIGEATLHETLIYRHIAWLATLRIQLRRLETWEHQNERNMESRAGWGTMPATDAELRQVLTKYLQPEEVDATMQRANRASGLLHLQSRHVAALFDDASIDNFRHMELAKLMEEMFTLQGKAERIKKFPLPRQYATGAHLFVTLFMYLMPFALVPACAALGPHLVWLSIPACLLLDWVFHVWDIVADYSENPFEGLINDIPMNSLVRTIEVDLRQMLGETELPPPLADLGDVMM